ncbi:Putative transcriptional repressor purR [Pseudolactococcus piscium]|nr:Putative transcriptional repressor purR [Lactococcus piscium]
MKLTLKDIAKQAGVSIPAVSQVLNNKPIRMTEAKRALIKKIAKDNHYMPNLAAKALVSNKTYTIGIIIPDINNPFFANLAKQIESQLRNLGYWLILVNSNEKFASEKELLPLLLNRGIDGLIFIMSNQAYAQETKLKAMLSDIDTPYVLVDRGLDQFDCNQIIFNNRLGGYLATKHLIASGHQTIGIMMNFPDNINCHYRYIGYQDALAESGILLDKRWVVSTKFDIEDAYDKAEQLLRNPDITSIVAGNDMIALGIIRKANELGKKIPEDISIIGYDNVFYTDLFKPSLTSIEQDVNAMATQTIAVLFETIADPTAKKFIQLSPRLVEKASVKKLT